MDIMTNAELKQFLSSCDEFILGKYIVADTKIAGILKAVSASEKIKNIIGRCLYEFDYDKEFKNATGEKDALHFTTPADLAKSVALSFLILYKIDNKEIEFYDFLNKYFKQENNLTYKEFDDFSKKVILPFKQAIEKLYTNAHILVNSDEYKSNIYNKIIAKIHLIKKSLGQYKLKNLNEEELLILLDSMVSACEQNQKQYVFAFMISIEYFTSVHKKCRPIFTEIQDCFK